MNPVPPVESLPFESLRALSLSNGQVEGQKAPCASVARSRGSQRAGMSVLNSLQAQRPKAADVIPWYGVNNRGFGLTELLIATLVGVIMLLGIGSFYISSVRFFEQSSSQTFLQRQGTMIMDEMSRRIQFANGLVEDPPTDCPATPSLKVTQPGVTGFYCFYQSSDQLLERLPDGTDFNLLDGTPQPISVSNVVFTATGGKRVTIGFQLNDDMGNTMAFATDLVARN